jgi:ATP-binding cassette subfamily C protein
VLSLVQKIFSFVDPGDRRKLIGLFILMVLTAILDMASIGLVLPIAQIIIQPDAASAWLPAFLADMDRFDLAVTTLVGFGVFYLLKTAAILLMVHVTNQTSACMMARFTTRVFRRHLRRPYLIHLLGTSSEMMQNTVMNCYKAFQALNVFLNIILEGLLATATGLLLLTVQPGATLLIGALFAVVGLVFYRFAGPLMQWWGSLSMRYEHDLLAASGQAFHSIENIKIDRCEAYFEGAFERLAHRDTLLRARAATFQHVPRLAIEALVILSFVVTVLVLLSIGQDFTALFPTLGLFLMAFLRLMPSLNRILQYVADIRHREAPVILLYNQLRQPDEVVMDLDVEATGSGFEFNSDIRLTDVTFTYPKGNGAVLQGVNLTIYKGESVGLVGPSGGGKSTLTDIIKGLIPPDQGQVMVDGRDIRDNLAGWQAHVSFVPQQIYLLDHSLRNNVAFGVPDNDIDEDRVRTAMSMAHMDSFTGQFPEGLDTSVGENGIRLSGGQRQRLGIARALYRDPNVIVFDEATSALDNEAEQKINAALDGLAGTKTLIIIAHRISTVHKCDRLIFIKDGRIDATGSFEHLMENNADFRRLVESGNRNDRDALS